MLAVLTPTTQKGTIMSLFTTRGETQGVSLQDALNTIVKHAAILQENQPANTGLAGRPSLNDEKRDGLISRAILTQEGKVALAQAMANPIRRNLDYQGIARRALVVDPLPQGATPTYDRDIDVSAVVVSSNGAGPESRVFGDRVVVPTFELFSNPTVRISEVRRRRFNVIDRAVQKARQEIRRVSVKNFWLCWNIHDNSFTHNKNN